MSERTPHLGELPEREGVTAGTPGPASLPEEFSRQRSPAYSPRGCKVASGDRRWAAPAQVHSAATGRPGSWETKCHLKTHHLYSPPIPSSTGHKFQREEEAGTSVAAGEGPVGMGCKGSPSAQGIPVNPPPISCSLGQPSDLDGHYFGHCPAFQRKALLLCSFLLCLPHLGVEPLGF